MTRSEEMRCAFSHAERISLMSAVSASTERTTALHALARFSFYLPRSSLNMTCVSFASAVKPSEFQRLTF